MITPLQHLVDGMRDEGQLKGTQAARILLNSGVVLVTRDEDGRPSLEIFGQGTPPPEASGPPFLTDDRLREPRNSFAT